MANSSLRTQSNETIRGHDEKSRHDARRGRTEIVPRDFMQPSDREILSFSTISTAILQNQRTPSLFKNEMQRQNQTMTGCNDAIQIHELNYVSTVSIRS